MRTPHYFLVAFGSSGDASLPLHSEEVTDELRWLINEACHAAFGAFPVNVVMSVGPSGVMVALPDATPERVMRLVDAVKARLDHAVKTHIQIIPVCAVITFGPMKWVDVLGYSSNFEGRPAIAAARILSKLRSGLLAVEESAWVFEPLARHLGKALRIEGKHQGEGFSIRLHRENIFPTSLDGPSAGPSLPSDGLFRELREAAAPLPSVPLWGDVEEIVEGCPPLRQILP